MANDGRVTKRSVLRGRGTSRWCEESPAQGQSFRRRGVTSWPSLRVRTPYTNSEVPSASVDDLRTLSRSALRRASKAPMSATGPWDALRVVGTAEQRGVLGRVEQHARKAATTQRSRKAFSSLYAVSVELDLDAQRAASRRRARGPRLGLEASLPSCRRRVEDVVDPLESASMRRVVRCTSCRNARCPSRCSRPAKCAARRGRRRACRRRAERLVGDVSVARRGVLRGRFDTSSGCHRHAVAPSSSRRSAGHLLLAGEPRGATLR